MLDPRRLTVLSEIGKGELSAPHDVAFDDQGRLWVADTGNDRIAVYAFEGVNADGTAMARLIDSLDQDMGSPEGVAAGPRGNEGDMKGI